MGAEPTYPSAASGVRWDDPAFGIEWPDAAGGRARDLRARRVVPRLPPVKRVLVTGGSGFVGRQTLGPLRERGYEVHAPRSRDARPARARHGCPLVDGSSAPTHLLHLAWDARPGKYWTSTDNLAWVRGQPAALRAFAEAGGERAVLAGTCAEYGWSDRVHCVEGATPLEPATLYGAAKHGLRPRRSTLRRAGRA